MKRQEASLVSAVYTMKDPDFFEWNTQGKNKSGRGLWPIKPQTSRPSAVPDDLAGGVRRRKPGKSKNTV